MVVIVVNNIGVKRVALADKMACFLSRDVAKFRLVVSIKIIALLTTIPNKLIKPIKAIIENDKFVKNKPNAAPVIAKGIAVKIIKKTVRNQIKIEASHGINDLDTALRFIDVGADRIGTSYADRITEEIMNQQIVA